MLGTVSVFCRGIPFIYQGQEIRDDQLQTENDISEYDDISTIDQYQEALRAGLSEEEALKCCYEKKERIRFQASSFLHHFWHAQADNGLLLLAHHDFQDSVKKKP